MKRTALVTGATGFLGAFFTQHLLRHGIPVVALIRNAAERSLLPTLHQISQAQGGFPEGGVGLFSAIDGNVCERGLGLADGQWDELRSRVTDIWHFAAAFDDQGRGGNIVRDTNVGGTQNLLDFVVACEQPLNFNMVGTAYAAPVIDNIGYERLCDSSEPRSNVYETTKVEAENLTSQICHERNIAFRIFRPPIVTGDSVSGMSLGYTGYQGIFRALYLLKRRLEVNLGSGFDGDLQLRVNANPELPISVVPVDFVTEAMYRSAETDRSKNEIFNITSEQTAKLSTLFSMAAQTLGVSGIHLSTKHDFETKPMTMAERLFRRRIEFQAPYFLRNIIFDNSNFRRIVPSTVVPSPMPDDDFLMRCNRYCLSVMEQEFDLDDANETETV